MKKFIKPLNCVLLIDDDAPTNFLHELTIKDAGFAKNVYSVQSGMAGLEFLASLNTQNEHPRPDLIFLDINMPGMNGWEFLVKYAEIPLEQKAQMVVVMLTTSLNPDDRDKAEQIGEVSLFQSKPLTKKSLDRLLDDLNS